MASGLYPQTPIVGALLAGGRSGRMGGNEKAFRRVGGQPIIERVIARLAPECVALLINANGDPRRFTQFGLPVVPDTIDGLPGPLAGVLAALLWTRQHWPATEFVLTVPADCPFLPHDLARRLHKAARASNAAVAVAASGGQRHHIVALWSISTTETLRTALANQGLSRVSDWVDQNSPAIAEWPDHPVDPFFNVNTPDDLAAAERLAHVECLQRWR